jgi:hypothetical protein
MAGSHSADEKLARARSRADCASQRRILEVEQPQPAAGIGKRRYVAIAVPRPPAAKVIGTGEDEALT